MSSSSVGFNNIYPDLYDNSITVPKFIDVYMILSDLVRELVASMIAEPT